jgi:sec-independent protein translocase protein TatA
MPFGIQPIHIFVIAIAALLIFGPSRLPEIGRSIGRGLTEFRRGAKEMSDNFLDEVNKSTDPVTPNTAPNPATQPIVPDLIQKPAQTACPTCGGLNPANSRFCNHCGSAME